eukprot:TRINITY_DN23222_c0_g1_i1.p1 TRINITY_DN23222_c0_g1~~TRINITY_DN23222_c0_g1_i1.p1  ORF type:complete len:174 (+),score=48.41 TRINITY_DN23222_c0_g1_i1:104-625(+)
MLRSLVGSEMCIRDSKYPILIQTLVIVGLAVAVRVCGFLYYDMFTGYIELGEIGMVFTGLFFFQGIVFNGVKSDLADAEKLPNSVVITLERIEDIFLYSARSVANKRLRFSYAQELLIHFARTWREYLVLKEEATYYHCCLLYTSDAADEEDSVDLGGRRIIKKKNKIRDVDS